MKWIDKKIKQPDQGVFDGCSKPVLVTDGKLIGTGVYMYNSGLWQYEFYGCNEQYSKSITHWMEFPPLPNNGK
jgi:hypothetical protein